MLQAVWISDYKNSGQHLIESPIMVSIKSRKWSACQDNDILFHFLEHISSEKTLAIYIPGIFLSSNLFQGGSLTWVFQSCPSLNAFFTSFWNFISCNCTTDLPSFNQHYSLLITYRSHLHVVHLSLMEAPIWHHFLLSFFLSCRNISAFKQLKRENIYIYIKYLTYICIFSIYYTANIYTACYIRLL